ncbi:MAG: alpha/beta fold hydrolase [Acidimicrobiales bacterium]
MAPVQRLVVPGVHRLPQFAHATRAGDYVYVSGTLGTDASGALVAGGLATETDQTLTNLTAILAAAHCGWDDVTSVSVYLADLNEFAAMNEVYERYFDGPLPARITIGGVDLALGARVEMQCVAYAKREATGDTAASVVAPARRTGFVEHDGDRLYYEVVGDESSDATPLVLCHGAGGNHASWFQQVGHFAADRMVVTWDHRGYGRSSDLGDRTGPLVGCGDLLAVLDALGVERADLVGQSMGGWSVVGAALARPGLARSIVLADTIAGFTTEAVVAGLAHARARGPERDALGEHPALGEAFSARSPALAHLYQSLGRMGSADGEHVIKRLLDVTYGEAEAARLTMPCLLIVGDHDQLFAPAAIRALADLLPDARIVEVVGAGHSPYFEDPRTWNHTVDSFLAWLDGADEDLETSF